MALVREISWQGSEENGMNGGGISRGMSSDEAAEVVAEAKRRLPIISASQILQGTMANDNRDYTIGDNTVPWGSGGVGTEIRRAPWPWGPKAVPPSAVGALVALAAALPPAGKLLAGVNVMLQVAVEIVAAAKAEAAVAAGVAAAASSSAGKGSVRRLRETARNTAVALASCVASAPEVRVSIEEVSRAAEQALLLYINEYCGKDPELWANVTEHVRSFSDEPADGELAPSGNGNICGYKLFDALLRRCGEELGGKALVRALPESLDLMECLNEVERSLLRE